MRSEDETETTYKPSMELLTEPGVVPETLHEDIDFVAEEIDEDDSSSDHKDIREGNRKKKPRKKQKLGNDNNTKQNAAPKFDRVSRHKKLVSPVKSRKNANIQILELPDKFEEGDDKYDKMIELSSNMESYFPSVEPRSASWNNVKALICHATHAYSSLKYNSNQLTSADIKIIVLEKKMNNWRMIL